MTDEGNGYADAQKLEGRRGWAAVNGVADERQRDDKRLADVLEQIEKIVIGNDSTHESPPGP